MGLFRGFWLWGFGALRLLGLGCLGFWGFGVLGFGVWVASVLGLGFGVWVVSVLGLKVRAPFQGSDGRAVMNRIELGDLDYH